MAVGAFGWDVAAEGNYVHTSTDYALVGHLAGNLSSNKEQHPCHHSHSAFMPTMVKCKTEIFTLNFIVISNKIEFKFGTLCDKSIKKMYSIVKILFKSFFSN